MNGIYVELLRQIADSPEIRLTRSRRTLLRKPWTCGIKDFHLETLLIPAFSLPNTPTHLTVHLHCIWNAPLPIPHQMVRDSSSSVNSLSLDHFRHPKLRPVSCYAFFKGWLLLSQPPGCFKFRISLTT